MKKDMDGDFPPAKRESDCPSLQCMESSTTVLGEPAAMKAMPIVVADKRVSTHHDGQAPLDVEVQGVLSRCQSALEALVNPSNPEHAPYAEALSAIIKIRPRLQTSLKRSLHRHRRFSLSSDSRPAARRS
mgnify:CR=1 FL=1